MSYYQQNPYQQNGGNPFGQQRQWDYRDVNAPAMAPGKTANAFLTRVFSVMAFGLGITGLVAWLFANTYLSSVENQMAFYGGPLKWVVMLSPFAFILVLSFGIHKLSYLAATLVYIAFAAVMGLSLASVFLVFAPGVIFQVFLMTAGTFGSMALVGALTSIDLTKFGSILMFALLGLIIVSIANAFMGSPLLHYIIGGVGVVVFAGLTAYDTQRLLRIGYQVQMGQEQAGKLALLGALSLYLDFINLFLFLLRLFGGSRD